MRTRLIKADDLWDGEKISVQAGARSVLLIKHGGKIYAYEDRCCHLGVSLSQGELCDAILTCPAHHWQYEITTGRGHNPCHVQLTTVPIKIIDGEVFLEEGA